MTFLQKRLLDHQNKLSTYTTIMNANPLENLQSIHNCRRMEGKFTCPICLDDFENNKKMTITCNHEMCFRCMVAMMRQCVLSRTCLTCPMCRYSSEKSENDCILIETPCQTQFNRLSYFLEPFKNPSRMKEIYICQQTFPTLTFDDLIGWNTVLTES